MRKPVAALRLLPLLFGRRWRWTTLLVIAAMAVMVHLGRWQLDRLEQRRARNAETARQLAAPPLDLSTVTDLGDLVNMHDRPARAGGEFDFERQIALKNQSFRGESGVHLITPLRIGGGDHAVLVDRGWIPYQEADPGRWRQFDEPATAVVNGHIQRSQKMPGGATSPIPETPQPEWFRVDIEALQAQMPYRLLPVYLLQVSEPGQSREVLPRRVELEVDLSEGPHMNYALQWFAFALILGVGYIHYVRRH